MKGREGLHYRWGIGMGGDGVDKEIAIRWNVQDFWMWGVGVFRGGADSSLDRLGATGLPPEIGRVG